MRGGEFKLYPLSPIEQGYLFGLFEGDGYKLWDKNSRHYQVEFYLNSVNDTKTINFLVSLLRKIGLKPGLYQDKRFNCKRIRVYSKEFFGIINKNEDITYRTKQFNIGFVSGMIDSEGYVNKKKSYITIVNTNKTVLKRILTFLESIHLKSTLTKRKRCIRDKLDSYRMYISVSFKKLQNISIKCRVLQ